MPGAGNRTWLITLTRDGARTGEDEYNAPIYGAPVSFDRLAERKDVSDGERFAAGQVGASLMTRFVVLSDADTRGVTPVYRLTHDGATWNILGTKETKDGRNHFIEITAVRRAE